MYMVHIIRLYIYLELHYCSIIHRHVTLLRASIVLWFEQVLLKKHIARRSMPFFFGRRGAGGFSYPPPNARPLQVLFRAMWWMAASGGTDFLDMRGAQRIHWGSQCPPQSRRIGWKWSPSNWHHRPGYPRVRCSSYWGWRPSNGGHLNIETRKFNLTRTCITEKPKYNR